MGCMHCLGCGFENPEGTKFCIECGTPLRKRCTRCGSENLLQARFCGECGTPLTIPPPVSPPHLPAPASQTLLSYTPKHLAEKILISRSVLEGERRQVTVLFADLAGFTALAERVHAGLWFGQATFFIGNVYLARGEYEEALRWYRWLDDYASAAGDKMWITRVPNLIGGLHLELFDLDEAIRLNLEVYRALGRRPPQAAP